MAISRPILPPKKGYVEVEVDGKRVYKKIETEQDQRMKAIEEVQNDTDYLMVDHEYRLTLLELGITE